MRNTYLEYAAAGVSDLRPYQPGKPLAELERELGIRDAIKLASNENPLGPSPLALAAIRDTLPTLALYPEGSAPELRARLAHQGQTHIRQNFSAQAMAQRYTVLYETLVERAVLDIPAREVA